MRLERFDDPRHVREQYATEVGLTARRAIYGDTTGPDGRDVALAAVAEIHGADAVRTYLASSECARPFVDAVEELDKPLVARRRGIVFVAETVR